MMQFEEGQIIELKKPHPCGSKDAKFWKIIRVGADLRLECMGCGHQTMMKRSLVEKMFRGKMQ